MMHPIEVKSIWTRFSSRNWKFRCCRHPGDPSPVEVDSRLPSLPQNLRRPPIIQIPMHRITSPHVEVSTERQADLNFHPANILLDAPVDRIKNLVEFVVGVVTVAGVVPLPERLPQRIHKVDTSRLAVAAALRSCRHALQSLLVDVDETAVPPADASRAVVVLVLLGSRVLGHDGFGGPLVEALAELRDRSAVERRAVFYKRPLEVLGEFGRVGVLETFLRLFVDGALEGVPGRVVFVRAAVDYVAPLVVL